MIYLIIASCIWAFSFGLMGKLKNLDPGFVSWVRLVIAVPAFLPFLRIKDLTCKISFRLMLIGGIQYGVMYSLYALSFRYLETYQVALFTIFTPLYVTIINDLFRREFAFINLVMALVAVAGAVVIKYKGIEFGNLITGFLLMQVSNICFAFGQLEYRRLRLAHKELMDRKVYAIVYIGAVIATTIIASFTSGWASIGLMRAEQFYILIYLGVVASGIGFFLWNVGAIKSSPGTLAVMNNMKIPLAVFVSLVFFGEKTDIVRLLIGGGLMIVAVIVTERYKNRLVA